MEPTATPETAARDQRQAARATARTVEVHNPATGQLIGIGPGDEP